MRNLVLTGLGVGFLLMGGGLFALSLKKSTPPPPNPNKSQLREQAIEAEETKKLRMAGGGIAGFGAVLLILAFI